MGDKLDLDKTVSLDELEERLFEAFKTSASRAKGTYSETGAGYANATARLADSLLQIRQRRLEEHDRELDDEFAQKKPRGLSSVSKKG